jgi:hypothetical protein
LGAVTAIFFLGWNSIGFALSAFPGVEGYGSETLGGRGGKVIQVKNTKDPGPTALNDTRPLSSPLKVRDLAIEVYGGAMGRLSLADRDGSTNSSEIFGRNGRLLYQSQMRNGCSHFDTRILPTGAYFFRVGNRADLDLFEEKKVGSSHLKFCCKKNGLDLCCT